MHVEQVANGNQKQVGGCGATYAVPMVAQRTVYDGAHSNGVLIQTFTYATNPSPFSATTWTSKNATVKSYDLIRYPSSVPPSGSTYDITQYTYRYVVAPQQPNVWSQPSPQIAVESQIIKGTASNPDQATTNKLWWHPSNYVTPVSLLACEDTMLPSGQSTMTYHFYGPSAQYWLPGAAAQETETDEFGFGALCGSTLPTYGILPSGLLRQTKRTFGNTFPNYTAFQYYSLPGGSPAVATQSIFDKPTAVTVGPDSTPAHILSETEYTSYDNMANLREIQRDCLNSYCANDLTYGATYDSYGNLATTTDAGHQITTYHFTSCNDAYLSEIDYPATGSISHEVKFNYDCPSGSLTSSTDQSNNTTDYSYTVSGVPEPLGRLTGITYPDAGSTTYTYHDTAPSPSVVTLKTNTPNNVTTTAVMNGLGQVTEAQVNINPQALLVDTAYDGEGRKYTVSNPYYSSPVYTTYAYEEATDRLISTTYPDSTQATTSFLIKSGLDCSLVTDAGGKSRDLCDNGLGQLATVWEDPSHLNYQTNYTYNVLDDLLTATQSGQSSRSFVYDSYSSLHSATNLETGTTSYYYAYSPSPGGTYCGGDETSPCIRVDANGNSTNYTYDNDNRILTKNYAAGDPTMRVCYAYDGQAGTGWGNPMTNAVGHLTSSFGITHAGTVVSGDESYQWDTMGRLQAQMQCTPATCGSPKYAVYRQYDLLGNETSFWDSSVVRYPTYDGANRLQAVTANYGVNPPSIGSLGPGSSLINITAYDPSGGLSSATLGNGYTESRAYTNRTWLGSILVKNGSNTVYSLTGPATGNLINYAGNGNVLNVIDNINGTWAYTYDGVNRLSAAVATGHSFVYTDDAYGDMNCVDNGSAHSPCTPSGITSTSFSNNKITASGFSYDANGNLLTTNNLTRGMVYDTENRLTCQVGTDGTCTSASATVYSYNPDGDRIAKTTGAGTLVEEYVYDLSGNQVSAHSSAGTLRNELYAPTGRHLANYSGGILTYNFADWLGSERVRTNSTGTETCLDTPYGMNLACSGLASDPSPMHFTGKQRDTETGLDYFGARFDASTLGRFMSPDWSASPEDVPYADPSNPQSLNLYSYVKNNPLTLVDTDGHEIIYADNLKNAQVVKDSVQAILADPNTNSNLSGYVGPNNPNLVIQSDDLSSGDTVVKNPDGTTTTTIVQGNTDASGLQTTTFTQGGQTSAPEVSGSTTITIDDRTSKGETPGIMVHESVHAGEARANPIQDGKNVTAEKKANPDCHDCRPHEQRANAAQKAYGPEIKNAVKKIESHRKKKKQ